MAYPTVALPNFSNPSVNPRIDGPLRDINVLNEGVAGNPREDRYLYKIEVLCEETVIFSREFYLTSPF